MRAEDDTTGPAGKRLWPRGRTGHLAMALVLVAGVLAATVGVGYSVSRPDLSDGAAYLARGHTVSHVNSQTGRTDAEVARSLASGAQRLETVDMPDGRVAVVNHDTGEVSFIDTTTMGASTPVKHPESGNDLDAVPTTTVTYLVDRKRGTVEVIGPDGKPAESPMAVPEQIVDSVPVGDSLWLVTGKGEVVQVLGKERVRTIPMGKGIRITSADNHPVVVDDDGTAYTVDGAGPTAIGRLDLPRGADGLLGSWRGPGRYVVGVDGPQHKVVAVDPRTHRGFAVTIPVEAGYQPKFEAPVVVGDRVYVPDITGPTLWEADLVTGKTRSMAVPGNKGGFTLTVHDGMVWANNQYDQRALVVDAQGGDRPVDKGVDADAPDSSDRHKDQDPPTATATPTSSVPARPSSAPATTAPTRTPTQDIKKVTVPSFPHGTTRDQACAELERLNLICNPVSSGDKPGYGADEVFGSTPKPGAQAPEHSQVSIQYVGPVKVPNLVGLNKDSACLQLSEAGWQCQAVADPDVVDAPAKLLAVTTQAPAAGTEVTKGSEITLHYPDTIAMPNYLGSGGGEACQELQNSYHLGCTTTAGTSSAGKCDFVGQTFDQKPAAGTVVKVDSTAVALSICDGTVTAQNWLAAGGTAQQVCDRVTAAHLQCTPQPGNPANNGETPGAAYAQTPAPGTAMQATTVVVITYWTAQTMFSVPNVVGGGSAGQACNTIAAAGGNMLCDTTKVVSAEDENKVVSQSPGPGSYPAGTHFTVGYSGWTPFMFWIWRSDSATPWTLGQTNNPPGEHFPVGKAYIGGTWDIPGHLPIYKFACHSGPGDCDGYQENWYYSRGTGKAHYAQEGSSVMELLPCTDGRSHEIHRVWKDENDNTPKARRVYGISDSPGTGGWQGSEPLGCTW